MKLGLQSKVNLIQQGQMLNYYILSIVKEQTIFSSVL